MSELTTKVCKWSSVNLAQCVDDFLENCDKNTDFIYRPLLSLRDVFCSPSKKAMYDRHHECFMKLYTEQHLDDKCGWSRRFYDLNILEGESERVQDGLCMMRKQLITCFTSILLKTCGLEAARVQKTLLHTLLKRAFVNIRCRYSGLGVYNQLIRTSSAKRICNNYLLAFVFTYVLHLF